MKFSTASISTNTGTATTVPYTQRNTYNQKVENWPSDDAVSLQQMAGDSCNLDLYYAHQFVQDEGHNFQGVDVTSNVVLEHTPVLAGTATGTILTYDEELGVWEAIQTFVCIQSGGCIFTDIGEQPIKAVHGSLNTLTGELNVTFNGLPGKNRLNVSYEYNYGGEADIPEVSYQPNDTWTSGGYVVKEDTKAQDFKNSTSYIDYLINQLAETKSKLVDVEEKLAIANDKLIAIREDNGGAKNLAELEVEMYNEFDKKTKNMKEYMVDKIDKFLSMKSMDEIQGKNAREIYDEATK